MSILKEFNKQVTTISQGGNHSFNEAVERTPKGFILTKLHRNLDYHHFTAEYTKIEEWTRIGGKTDGVDHK